MRVLLHGRKSLAAAASAVEFQVVLPRERLTLKELVETAKTVNDPDTAQTALLRLAAAALGLCCPDIGKGVSEDRRTSFAKCGYSAIAFGGPAYEWLASDRFISDVEIIEQGMAVMRCVFDQVGEWQASREAVNAAKKDSGAPTEPGTGAPTP